MALVSRSRCSRDARSRGGDAGCFTGGGAVGSFFGGSVVAGEAEDLSGAFAGTGGFAADGPLLAMLWSVGRGADGVVGGIADSAVGGVGGWVGGYPATP